ncbi:MAG: hypothetical protein ACREUF_01325 [Solimonas sp.]
MVELLTQTGVVLVLLALGWAAIERGRVHRKWAQVRRRLQNVQSDKAAGVAVDWGIAMGAMIGWV